MKLKKKIIKGLEEYFLGLETRKELDYQKAFYIEYLTNEDFLGGFLYQFNKIENRYIFLGKSLPMIIEETGLIASLITRIYDFAIGGVICGNLLRIAMLRYNPAKFGREVLDDNLKILNNGRSLEENALEILEHSWHRTEVDDYKDLDDNS